MRVHLDALERHGELVEGVDRYSGAVRVELLSMSAASIDRYLAPARAKDAIGGVSTTKPSPLLRSSIAIRRAGDEVEQPGTGPAVLVAGQVDHAGEHPRATRARIDVVPHVLIDPEHRDTVEPGRVGLQRFQVGAHSVPHGVPVHPQPTGQT